MTTPPANPPVDPPADPDAGLTDEQKAAKTQFKSWFKEAVTEMRAEEETEPPKRTKTPDAGGSWFATLFGGQS